MAQQLDIHAGSALEETDNSTTIQGTSKSFFTIARVNTKSIRYILPLLLFMINLFLHDKFATKQDLFEISK